MLSSFTFVHIIQKAKCLVLDFLFLKPPKNAQKLRMEVIGPQHQPPSLCTRSGEPCILPFLYSGKPLLLIPSYLQCKLCNLHKSYFLKSLTWPDFETANCTSANQIISKISIFLQDLGTQNVFRWFSLILLLALSILPSVHYRIQGIRLEIILILIPGVTSASALVRQLCHLNWRDGELVLLLAMLITKTNPVWKFLLIQFGIFSAKSSSQQTKISQNYVIREWLKCATKLQQNYTKNYLRSEIIIKSL